ncbi:MAG TPA: tRNA pseudouridine(55) synthase TruB [Herpetosiphonaceae bacterium]
MLHGFVVIDKPAGMTSHDVVSKLRRLAGQKRVGHGGTLDPMATGVLPIALGNATRLLEYLQEEDQKAYLATVRLGAATDTDDAEGQVISEAPVPPLARDELERALDQFRGAIEQVPPNYAAIRVDGRRLYSYARAGEEVPVVPARPVTIERLELLAAEGDELTIDVKCSKGTYIRALARDLGAALGCGAHLTALRRTQAGAFALGQAVPLQALLDEPALLPGALLAPQAALADWPLIAVSADEAALLGQGRRIPRLLDAPRAALLDDAGRLLAVAEAADAEWQPGKVFSWT